MDIPQKRDIAVRFWVFRVIFLFFFFFLAFNTLAQTVPWAAVCVHRNFVAKHKSDDDGTVVAELNAVSS